MTLSGSEKDEIWRDLDYEDRMNILQKAFSRKNNAVGQRLIERFADMEFFNITGKHREKISNAIEYYYRLGGGLD